MMYTQLLIWIRLNNTVNMNGFYSSLNWNVEAVEIETIHVKGDHRAWAATSVILLSTCSTASFQKN